MRILVCDDMSTRWELIKGICVGHDCHWETMIDGSIDRLGREEFDLVFLDFDLEYGETSTLIARAIADRRDLNPVVIIHSDNPDGALKLREILPDSVVYPVSRMTRVNPDFSRLRQLIATSSNPDLLRAALKVVSRDT